MRRKTQLQDKRKRFLFAWPGQCSHVIGRQLEADHGPLCSCVKGGILHGWPVSEKEKPLNKSRRAVEDTVNLRPIDFFAREGLIDHGEGLFDQLEGFLYFVKDTELRFVAVNNRLLEKMGLRDASEVIGKTDHDFFPPSMADAFRRDDLRILETGEPILNKVELVPRGGGFVDWSTTTKIPLRDAGGSIRAIAGVTRPFASDGVGMDLDLDLGPTIREMKQNFASSLPIPELARKAGLSLSAFERKFKKAFHMTPRAYIRHLRVHEACFLLSHSSHSLAEIAHRCGFSDQSHLSREFSRIMNKTPSTYRKAYRPA